MKTSVTLIFALPCLVLALAAKDGGIVPQSSYDVPPTIHQFDQPLPQPQPLPPPQPHNFNYPYQPSYADQAPWNSYGNDASLVNGGWLDKGIKLLADVIPVAISVIIIISVLAFLGLIKVPLITEVTEARELLSGALSNIDMDQLANTVTLAINKYNDIFHQR